MKIGYSLQLGDLNMKIKRHLYIKTVKSENKTTVCAVQYSPIVRYKKVYRQTLVCLKSDPLLSDIFEKTPRLCINALLIYVISL